MKNGRANKINCTHLNVTSSSFCAGSKWKKHKHTTHFVLMSHLGLYFHTILLTQKIWPFKQNLFLKPFLKLKKSLLAPATINFQLKVQNLLNVFKRNNHKICRINVFCFKRNALWRWNCYWWPKKLALVFLSSLQYIFSSLPNQT